MNYRITCSASRQFIIVNYITAGIACANFDSRLWRVAATESVKINSHFSPVFHCHCEQSEAISGLTIEIAAACCRRPRNDMGFLLSNYSIICLGIPDADDVLQRNEPVRFFLNVIHGKQIF